MTTGGFSETEAPIETAGDPTDSTGAAQTLCEAACVPTTFASEQDVPTCLAVDDTYVWWTVSVTDQMVRYYRVRRRAKAGGPITQTELGRGIANRIVVDDTHIYGASSWVDGNLTNSLLRRYERSNGAGTTLLGDFLASTRDILGDATHLYWTNGLRVQVMAKSNTAVTTFAEAPGTGIAQDDDFIYWGADDGVLNRRAKAGGAVETLLNTGRAITTVTVDDTHVYWAEPDADQKRTTSNCQEFSS